MIAASRSRAAQLRTVAALALSALPALASPAPTAASAAPHDPSPTARPAAAVASPLAEPPADFAAEAIALQRLVACIPGAPPAPRFDPAIVAAYCARQGKAMAAYRDGYLRRAAPFLAKLRPAGLPASVVYPFGGGDLLSALTTYPDATDYTTLSLEHAGDPRRLDALSDPARLAESLELVRATSAGLLYASDSKTENLMKGQRGEIPGQLAFFLTALAVHGYEPVGLRFFRIERDGRLHYYTPSEIAALQGKEAKLLRGKWTAPDFSMAFSNSELRFVRRGAGPGAPVKVHRHVAWDLSDRALARTGIVRYLEAKGPVVAMTKAASYLLWRDDFSRIRGYLLHHMVLMISDSTGIPPTLAADAGFVQETYGTFESSFLDASDDYNAQFRALWASQPHRRLPFRYGYIDGLKDGEKPAGRAHLLVTRRAPPAP